MSADRDMMTIPNEALAPGTTKRQMIQVLRERAGNGGAIFGALDKLSPDEIREEAARMKMAHGELKDMIQRIEEIEALTTDSVVNTTRKKEEAVALIKTLKGSEPTGTKLEDILRELATLKEAFIEAERAALTQDITDVRDLAASQQGLASARLDAMRQALAVVREEVVVKLEHDVQTGITAKTAEAARLAEEKRLQGLQDIANERGEVHVNQSDDIRHRETQAKLRGLDLLTGRLPLTVASGAQGVSAYLSASGIAAMMRASEVGGTVAQMVIPGGIALSLNGLMFFLTASYHNGGWRFRSNPGMAAMFAATGLLTVGTNYAGMTSEFVPSDIVEYVANPKLEAARDFVAEVRPVLADKIDKPTTIGVQKVSDDGMALYDEATGKGPTREYGFRGESIKALKNYRQSVSLVVTELADIGACGGIEAVDEAYRAVMDRLQTEQDTHPDFYRTNFVNTDASGAKLYDYSAQAQIDACKESNPIEPKALVTEIEKILENLKLDISDGKIKDTTELNPEIRELNDKMESLSRLTEVEFQKIALADPMFFESWKILFDTLDNIWEKHVEGGQDPIATWPVAMAIFSGIQDQLGILIAMVAAVAATSRRRVLAERGAEIQGYHEGLDELGRRSDGWLTRLKALASSKKS